MIDWVPLEASACAELCGAGPRRWPTPSSLALPAAVAAHWAAPLARALP